MINGHFDTTIPVRLSLAAIVCLILAAAGQASEVSSYWVNEPVSIDGQAEDHFGQCTLGMIRRQLDSVAET